MQDVKTGRMDAVTKEQYEAIYAENLAATKARLMGPPTPVYRVGEVVDVKGGRFRILKLTPAGMILKGVPISTPLGSK